MRSRKLTLEREALTGLTSGDLDALVGAATGTSCGATRIHAYCEPVVAPTLIYTCIVSVCPCPTN